MQLTTHRTFEELMEISLNRLSKTPITEVGPGGVARLLLAIINEHVSEFYDVLQANTLQAFLSTATGEGLDLIGELLNCARWPEEDDDNYRYRISKQTLTLATANETAIRLAVLSVDGVRDMVSKPFTHGTGSFSVYVVTDNVVPSDELLAEVQKKIDTVKADGIRAEVMKPKHKTVSLGIKLIFDRRAPDIDKKLIINSVRQNVQDYINSRSLGEPLIVNEITEIIMSTSEYIFDFDVMSFAINDRAVLWVNQETNWNERFIESDMPNAISVS